jgi:hypothetical protein
MSKVRSPFSVDTNAYIEVGLSIVKLVLPMGEVIFSKLAKDIIFVHIKSN